MRASRPSLLLLVALAASAIAPTGVTAADPVVPDAIGDEVLVRYRANVTPSQRRAVTRDLDLTVLSTSVTGRTEVVVGRGISAATVRRRLDADPRVVAVSRMGAERPRRRAYTPSYSSVIRSGENRRTARLLTFDRSRSRTNRISLHVLDANGRRRTG